jgi:Protein of unknown function (DUF2778)
VIRFRCPIPAAALQSMTLQHISCTCPTETLEAHSGLGSDLDNPDNVSIKGRGPTPPNVYGLAVREQLFHGIRAIRLIPVGERQHVWPRWATCTSVHARSQRPVEWMRFIQ